MGKEDNAGCEQDSSYVHSGDTVAQSEFSLLKLPNFTSEIAEKDRKVGGEPVYFRLLGLGRVAIESFGGVAAL
jgi:hypothetical protein